MAQEWGGSPARLGRRSSRARAWHALPFGCHFLVPVLGTAPHRHREFARAPGSPDVDARQPLDLSMGLAPMLVGHLHPLVVEYVTKDGKRGPCSSRRPRAPRRWPTFRSGSAWNNLRFANSGTEATMYAVKGRSSLARPAGDHQDRGWLPGGYDALSVGQARVAGPVEESPDSRRCRSRGRAGIVRGFQRRIAQASTSSPEHGDEISAVVIKPVLEEHLDRPARRRIPAGACVRRCDRHGALLS